MCIICVQLEKDKLTAHEAYRNLSEMKETMSEEHVLEVEEGIYKKLFSRTSDIEDKELDLWAKMLGHDF